MWAILIVTLPTQPNTVRVRVWRALKALGCAALRDGAYLLPADREALFDPLAADVRDHGGTARVLHLSPRDDAQRDEVLALFDRGEAYVRWRALAHALRADFESLAESESRRRLRSIGDALHDLLAIDHYPGAAAEQAQAELLSLRAAVESRFTQGEPQARAAGSLARLDKARFQARRWATRARPWVDRLACAWLIRRFIDPQSTFVWLPDTTRLPRGAIGFDFDGARFTHVGARITFEVMTASFGLDADPRLQHIGTAVHYLDVGGIPVPEAAGLEAVLSGLREVHADDDRLVEAAAVIFDALYAAPSERPREVTSSFPPPGGKPSGSAPSA